MTKSLFLKFIALPLFLLIFNHKVGLGFQQQSGNLLPKSDTAFVPKEIEDPKCIGINKEFRVYLKHQTLLNNKYESDPFFHCTYNQFLGLLNSIRTGQ